MNENKSVAIIFCAVAAIGVARVISSSIKEGAVEVEKEKTKQLEIRFKTDSLNATKKK